MSKAGFMISGTKFSSMLLSLTSLHQHLPHSRWCHSSRHMCQRERLKSKMGSQSKGGPRLPSSIATLYLELTGDPNRTALISLRTLPQ